MKKRSSGKSGKGPLQQVSKKRKLPSVDPSESPLDGAPKQLEAQNPSESVSPEVIVAKPEILEPQPSKPFPIVGIGASAGGYNAFVGLLRNLPADSGMAFVLVQHMDPTHESVLNKLLAKETQMPVIQVSDGLEVIPNHAYVIPPNKEMTIRKGILRLVARPGGASGYSPIDAFFTALALDQRSAAIGVILSGIGSDGTRGLKAIKAEGGITFVQDEKSAKFPGMPASAFTAGCVDFVLPPQEIAKELSRAARHPYLTLPEALVAPQMPIAEENGNLRRICRLLQTASGVDFSLYKPSTIRRRIARRMVLRQIPNLSQYVQFMEKHPEESAALFEDILIHVTAFFREPEAFNTLQKKVFPKIIETLKPGDDIRIWVPGCSSGEEPYSIAIALLEFLGDRASDFPVQIFATDISTKDIEKARAGKHPESALAEVSPAIQRRYFTKAEGNYQISDVIRDMCVFARQDLGKDPPFSQLNLISCQNVLIYMGPVLQKRIMATFHYALRPNGFLWLGKSEAISAYSDYFTLEDRKFKFYSRRPAPAPPIPEFTPANWPRASIPAPKGAEAAPTFDLRKEGERILLERYAPCGFIMAANQPILHFLGDTARYVKPTPGEPSFHLLKMVRRELVLEIHKALLDAKKTGSSQSRKGVEYQWNGGLAKVDIDVVPIRSQAGKEPEFLIVFQEVRPREAAKAPPIAKKAKTGEEEEIGQLKHELESAREYLRSLMEDQEASTEELRAANEEVLSSNEELQSSNEELETAHEELQSSNEELTTLNEELQNRNIELAQSVNGLNNVLAGAEIPIMLLGKDRRIRRYTPMPEKLMNLLPTDVGRPISNVQLNLDVPNLDSLLTQAESDHAVDQEVQDASGHWYCLRLRPYKTAEGETEGVLMALLDIDSVKRASVAVVETMREALLVLDEEFRIISANPALYQMFHIKREETENQVLFLLRDGPWDSPRLRELLQDVLPQKREVENFELEINCPIVGRKRVLLNAREIHPANLGRRMILVVLEDLTERKRAEERFRNLLEAAPDAVVIVNSEGRIEMVNFAAEKLFGYRRDELAGQPVERLVPKRFREPHVEHRKRFSEEPHLRPMNAGLELYGLRKDGTEFPADISLGPLETAEGILITTAIRDITERKRVEMELRNNEKELRLSQEKLRTLAHALTAEGENIQRRMARGLHDGFPQKLTAIGLRFSMLQKKLPPASRSLKTEVLSISGEIRALEEEIRQFARTLHPAILDQLGLLAALQTECEVFSNTHKIPVRFSHRNIPRKLCAEVSLALYRIVQEGLSNVAQHAGNDTTFVQITLRSSETGVKLTIRDNGCGFDPESARQREGLGLISMEERTRAVGGNFAITSTLHKGTEITVQVPLEVSVETTANPAR
ncbi:MAG: PAS domain S-box protein [Acidobacteria bacterium]|nr:PAS domain S-box protein [Acidobacteriota bacterium]